MAELTGRDLHIDILQTNLSIGYKNPSYVADMMFPIVPVGKQSNLIPQYLQSPWFRDDAHLRAPGTASRRGSYGVSTANYFCHRYSFGHEIPDELRDNQDSPYDVDRDGTMFATDRVQLRRERAFAADFFTTSVWGTDSTPAVLWSTYGTSDPLVDITGYLDTIEGSIGIEGNKILLGKEVWTQLRWHPDVLDTIKHTQRGIATTEILAALLGLAADGILVGRTIFTSDPEGTAEASVTYSRVWGKHALVLYVTPTPSLMAPSAGYTFTWTRVPNSIQYIRRMRNEEREVDIIEANSYFDQKATVTNAGVFVNGAVA